MQIDSDTLACLIQGHLDQRLSDEEFEALQAFLRENSEARQKYSDMARLDAGLSDAGLDDESNVVAFRPSNEKRNLNGWTVVAAVAVVTAFLAPLALLLRGKSVEEPPGPQMAEVSGVAVITAEAGAVWENEDFATGVALKPGPVVLKKGLAQIDFFGGTSISLSGPAKLELVDGDTAILHAGILKADVPPAARGFEVRAVDVVLEDLGTSFGLSVEKSNRADLIVFDGEVRATGLDGSPKLFFGSDSALFDSGKVIRQSADKVGDFPDITEVIAGSGSREELRYAAWRESSLDRRRDPRLIAYYDFENLTAATRRLRNQALYGEGLELDGGIVGARVAKGRWGRKTSLDFRAEGDRVRFNIPGEWEALTFYAWVRIDALDRGLNSLFLTDHFDENEIHWQLSRSGHMNFATSPMGALDIPEHNRRFFSEEFWDPSMSGQWLLLAVTAEKGIGKVKSYVNGKPIEIVNGTQTHKPLQVMRIGKADLGNWSEPIWEHSIRTLNGRVDEFAIYSEALLPEEIARIYEDGRP
jgi:hypothetical protein